MRYPNPLHKAQVAQVAADAAQVAANAAATAASGAVKTINGIAPDSNGNSPALRITTNFYNGSGQVVGTNYATPIVYPCVFDVAILRAVNTAPVCHYTGVAYGPQNMTIVAVPEGPSGAPIYRNINLLQNSFEMGAAYFSYGVNATPDQNYCAIFGIYTVSAPT